MEREFAWNPRSVTIMSMNCSARSTFDISSVPAISFPLPAVPEAPTLGVPELLET